MSSNAKPELFDLEWLEVPLQVAHIDDIGAELVLDGLQAFFLAQLTTAELVPPVFVTLAEPTPNDTTHESLAEPVLTPWYAVDGLDGMELVVQRVKREARAVEGGVGFGAPLTQVVIDSEEGGGDLLVVLRIFLPKAADGFEFRDELFGRLAEQLRPEDAARLALRVVDPA